MLILIILTVGSNAGAREVKELQQEVQRQKAALEEQRQALEDQARRLDELMVRLLLERFGLVLLNQDKRHWDTSLDGEAANPEIHLVACPDVGCYDLDQAGNSAKGQQVAKFLSQRLGLDLFVSKPEEHDT